MPKEDEDKPATGASATGGSGQQAGSAAPKPATAQTPASEDAVALLTADHRKVEALFAEFDRADDDRKTQIIREACKELNIHAIVEEQIFYPACRQAASDEEPLDEAQVEHDSAKLLIRELMDGQGADRFRQARFKVLAEQMRHHIAEEEKPREGIFAKAKAQGVDLAALGPRIQARKQELQSEGEAVRPTRPVSFQRLDQPSRTTQETYDMARNNGPERDERGRFVSDDDDRGRRRYSAERYGGGRRYEDDDDRGRGRDRGQGGWFGDSEGHSEASRRGWDNPDHAPSGWFGDSRGHSEASRRGWDNPDHAPSGWFGDSRGHSEASRRGWDNPDHGRSGWYGDPEGHSEASRRGWEERRSYSSRDRDDRDDDRGSRSRSRYDDDDDRGYRSRGRDEEGRFTSRDDDRSYRSRDRDDDDRRYRSRSRDDDDDDRRSRGGRDQGGWFGDSRGHAEAARRGWEGRR